MVGAFIALLLAAPPQAPRPPQAPPVVPVIWSTDYESARNLAIGERRPLLVRFTASWCVPCKTLARTLALPEVADAIRSGRFVCVVVDADARPDLVRSHRVTSLPTLYREDVAFGLYRRATGVQRPEVLIRDLLR